MKRLLIPALFAMASLAFAQLDSNSITVTSTRGSSLQPDEVVFSVFVDAPVTATLSDVLAALSGSAITAANFAGVGTASGLIFGTISPLPPTAPQLPPQLLPPQPMLEWAFGLPVPFAKMKDTTAALAALQQTFAKNNPGFTLTFNVQGTTVSQQAQQSFTCSVPDLLADARAQAQKLADASGLILGAVLAMSSGTNNSIPSGSVVAGISIGRFYTSAPSLSAAPFCSLTVKFAVTRF